MTQIKWLLFALVASFVLVMSFTSIVFKDGTIGVAQTTFLGLNLFLEILIFFIFSTFVVFGIKGFFEMYSHKTSNRITLISGALLFVFIIVLWYKILFQD